MSIDPEQTPVDPLENEAEGQKKSSTRDAIKQPEEPELKHEIEKQPSDMPDNVVIPDECGDSLWEDVLAQHNHK